MSVQLLIDEYGNGYRPTATGRIGGRSFYFRSVGQSWSFGVATEAATKNEFWWHSPDAEFEFETGGDTKPMFHTERLPTFLEGLRRYLASLGMIAGEREVVEAEARRQAEALFARESMQ